MARHIRLEPGYLPAEKQPLTGSVAAVRADGLDLRLADGSSKAISFTPDLELRFGRKEALPGALSAGMELRVLGSRGPDGLWARQIAAPEALPASGRIEAVAAGGGSATVVFAAQRDSGLPTGAVALVLDQAGEIKAPGVTAREPAAQRAGLQAGQSFRAGVTGNGQRWWAVWLHAR